MTLINRFLITLFWVVPTALCAQESEQSSGFLEEIIVTAQKRSESVQDVPIAINALSGNQLEKFGVQTSDNLASLFPNLTLRKSSSINNGFTIRGVGTNNFHITAQPSVGNYFDEVSFVTPFSGQFGLYDLERIEILRGPQNTLFGRNTTGGAINYISKKPSLDEGTNGYIRARVGNEGRADLEAAVGFKIADNAAGRISYQTQNRDGLYFDLISQVEEGDIDRDSGRVQFLWAPDEDTEVLFNAHVGYNRGGRIPQKVLGFWAEGSPNIGTPGNRGAPDCPLLGTSSVGARFDGANNCVTAVGNQVFNPSTDSFDTVRDEANDTADVDFEGLFLRVDRSFANFDLTSITSYDETSVLFEESTSSNGVLGFHPGQDGTFEVFSQEIRLASTNDGPFRWIGGLYYSSEDDKLGTVIRNGSDGTPPFTVVPSVVVEQDVEIFSAYGQIESDITDALTLTVGLRYTSDEKDGTSTTRVIAGTDTGLTSGVRAPDDFLFDIDFLEQVTSAPGTGLCPPPVGGLPCQLGPIPVEQDLSEWGGKVGLDWRLSDEVLTYISYSRGFKSGSFDTRALAAFAGNADRPVGPEFLDAYEIGVKTTFLDGAIEFNAAAFYYQWDDLQQFAVDETGGVAFLNIPESELYGIEADIKWDIGAGWYTQFGIGFLDTEIIDATGVPGVVEGGEISLTPGTTWNGVIAKTFDTNNGNWTFQTDFNYSAGHNGSQFGSDIRNIESAFFLNARVSYLFGSEQQYEVSLWGENLTEEQTCGGGIFENGSLQNGVGCLLVPDMAFYGITAQIDF